jgi:hypothetical protein
VATSRQIKQNTVLLALCLVTLSGVLQLAVAVATITLVLVTGIESILGLGPAIFITAAALAALPGVSWIASAASRSSPAVSSSVRSAAC